MNIKNVNTDPAIWEGMPNIGKGYRDDTEAAFIQYIFYRTDGNIKYAWCTACDSQFIITKEPQRSYCYKPLWKMKHGDTGNCPHCDAEVIFKCRGRFSHWERYDQWQRAAYVMPVNHDTVYIRAYYAHRYMFGIGDMRTEYSETAVYRLTAGDVQSAKLDYTGFYSPTKRVCTPFAGKADSPAEYKLFYDDSIYDTFLKYHVSNISPYKLNYAIKYLAACALYPQIEMLLKLGYSEYVTDLLYNDRKNTDVVNWKADSLTGFFKLTKAEMKVYSVSEKSIRHLRIYKQFRKVGCTLTNDEVTRFLNITHDKERLAKTVKLLGAITRKAPDYLDKAEHDFAYWCDYIDAAEACGYDLKNPVVIFPKNLVEAHDRAIDNRVLIENKEASQQIENRYKALDKQYGFEHDGYLIRPPRDFAEIVNEGIKLRHCVGGYADRHANGKVTILFMRKADEPETPLYTIEMDGKRLKQVHGFRNSTAPKDSPDTQQFFTTWLEWVIGGSKRTDGEPVLPLTQAVLASAV